MFEDSKTKEPIVRELCANCKKEPRLPTIFNNEGKPRTTDLCLKCNQDAAYHQRMYEYRLAMKS